MKQKTKKILKFILWVFTFFILPLALSFTLLPPWEKIPLPCEGARCSILIEPEVFETPSRDFISSIFSISFIPKSYKISINNKPKNDVVKNPLCLNTPGGPLSIYSFPSGNPEKYEHSLTRDDTWMPDYKRYALPAGQSDYFTYKLMDRLEIQHFWLDEFITTSDINCIKEKISQSFEIYAKPYSLAWASKTILFFIIYWGVSILIFEVFRILMRIIKGKPQF